MDSSFQAHIYCFISFLTVTTFASKTEFGVGPSFKFYYSEDSECNGHYYIIEPDIKNIDMEVVGCTNLTMPLRLPLKGLESSSSKEGCECVILFKEPNCQGEMVSASSSLESQEGPPKNPNRSNRNKLLLDLEVKSFHLCSWKPPPSPDSLTKHQMRQYYTLHSYDGPPPFQVEYNDSDVKDCKIPVEFKDKRVTSFLVDEGCLHLFANENCSGTPVTLKSSVDWINFDPSSVPRNNVRSMKACGMVLQAKITKFRPASSQPKQENGQHQKIEISPSKKFVNSASTHLLMTYAEEHVFNETFAFQSIPSLSLLSSVEVSDNMSLDSIPFPHLCFPDLNSDCLAGTEMKGELKNAYQSPSLKPGSQDQTSKHQHVYVRPRKFSFRKEKLVEPCSIYEARPFLQVKRNLSLTFHLGFRLSGENHGEIMSPVELRSNLPRKMNYSRDLKGGGGGIFAKVRGGIIATVVGVKPDVEFELVGMVDGCIKRKSERRLIMPMPPTAPTTRRPTTPVRIPTRSSVQLSRSDFDPYYDTNRMMSYNPPSRENKVEDGLGLENLFLSILIGIAISGIFIVCLLTIFSRRGRRRPSEFEIVTVGEHVLTIEFLCCCSQCK